MGQYDTAQICLNGHVITTMAASSAEFREDFCTKCGEKTIMNCQNCNHPIKGFYHMENVFSVPEYDIPKFCEKCGHAYPWTTSQADAAKELVDMTENLNADEKIDMKNSIDDLIKDSPKTIVAQTKYKKYASKVGTEIAKGIKDILIDIVSETVKKTIWGK